ncbi:MAG: RNase P subunit p30 family protein [Sulfolobales archaeon]
MYVDLNISPYGNVELEKILRTAERMGYVAAAVEGLNKIVEGNLVVLPRVTYRYMGKPLSADDYRKGHLVVYEVYEPAMIKSLTSLRGKCHAIKISGNVLVGLKKKYVKALRNCGIPIEISLKDLLTNNSINYNVLRGLIKLIPYIEKGDIELVVSSSAGDVFELMHPLEVIALLKELGLSELVSVKAVSSLPSRILKVVRDGV